MDFSIPTNWDTSTDDTVSASGCNENTTCTSIGTVHFKDEVDIREEVIHRREESEWARFDHKDARRSFPNKTFSPSLKSLTIKIRGNR